MKNDRVQTLKDTITFLFLVDTSGSMYGSKIASVNATLKECFGVLKNTEEKRLDVLFAGFDEVFQWRTERKCVLEASPISFEVTPKEDGFYRLTSLKALYQALAGFFERMQSRDQKYYIIVFTDGKVIDSKQCEMEFEKLNSQEIFRNAERYVAVMDSDRNVLQKDVLEFVDYQADHILNLSEVSEKISCLNMIELGQENKSDREVFYDSIFQ